LPVSLFFGYKNVTIRSFPGYTGRGDLTHHTYTRVFIALRLWQNWASTDNGEARMLMLTRKAGELIKIGDDIEVKLISIKGYQARIKTL
jgi:hypothetical protein